MEGKIVALDIETTGLSFNDEIMSVAAAWRGPAGIERRAWAMRPDLFHPALSNSELRTELQAVTAGAAWIVAHNGVFDFAPLMGRGVFTDAELRGRVLDTLLAARMTGPHDSVSLVNLCREEGLSDPDWEAMKKHRGSLEGLDQDHLHQYNMADAEKTLLLAEILLKRMRSIYDEDFIRQEHDFVRLMSAVRWRGKPINRQAARNAAGTERSALLRGVADILRPAGIEGPSDRVGILRYLEGRGLSTAGTTPSGSASVDEDSLAPLAEHDSVIAEVLRARGAEKALGTWLEGMLEHADDADLVHANYVVAGAVSYRLTCSHPNLQAVPSAHAGIWDPHLSADYSQAEIRVAAAYAKEEAIARMLKEGEDIHSGTSRIMFGDAEKEHRRMAKSCNFASIYGGGVGAVVRATGLPDEKVKALLASHRRAFPALYSMSKLAEKRWKENGYLKLMLGKRLYATKEDLELRPYKAFNQLIQGSVSEMVQRAMMTLDAAGVEIIGQVHDSIECAEGTDPEIVRAAMISAFPAEMSERTSPAIFMAADIEVKGSRA